VLDRPDAGAYHARRLSPPPSKRAACGRDTRRAVTFSVLSQCHRCRRGGFIIATRKEESLRSAIQHQMDKRVDWTKAHAIHEMLDCQVRFAQLHLHPTGEVCADARFGLRETLAAASCVLGRRPQLRCRCRQHSQCFEAGSDVDAVAINASVVVDGIAKAYPDTKFDAARRLDCCVRSSIVC